MSQIEDKCRNIVVAIDGGEHSQYALEWALRCVVRRDTDIVYLVAVERPNSVLSPRTGGTTTAIPEDDALTVEEETTQHADTVLEKAEELCKQKHVTSVRKTYQGEPRERVCQACEELRADMLVVGSRGLSAVRRAFVASISHHCARLARCPVIVVRYKGGG